MAHSDRELIAALRNVIRTEISDRINLITEAQENKNKSFDIEDYRDDIETMISEYINNNVTIIVEG